MSGKTVLYVAVISLAVVVAYERYGSAATHRGPRLRTAA